MIFKYKALSGDKVIVNNIDAEKLEDAKDKIKRQGLRPIKIEENIESTNSFKVRTKFNYKDLFLLFKQLSLLIGSGINVEKSFDILSSQFKKDKSRVLKEVLENLRSGMALSASMEISGAFPNLVTKMVYVGENTSSLDKIFENLSNYYFRSRDNRSKIINALSYPIILLITSILIINFLIINVIPSFTEIFQYNDNILPFPTRIIIALSNFIYENYIFLILFLLIFLIIFYYLYKKKTENYHKILLKSNYYKMIETLNFTFNMNLLLNSGLTVDRSLEILSSMEKNLILKDKYKNVLQKIKSGEAFWKSLKETEIFPQILISMIRVGEESSSLREIFKEMSKFYEDELENQNKRFLGILGPILIIILSIFVGFIVLSIALPIFDMVNQF
ncbi:type II secretion system F family protein [Peptoniphilus sp. MSJ-1]|uniref:Type II secretion system F family protein n=1 Tax=Peptoniphilus ovalis TaxID=2841503 RepID=A0ABS6FIQ6_9FIRM|nr:type II secretion system F family protein [Peptoniphilus ovalis]MBU5670055.1 type II secretion system F family protein [Peptoniphilus ovalis]